MVRNSYANVLINASTSEGNQVNTVNAPVLGTNNDSSPNFDSVSVDLNAHPLFLHNNDHPVMQWQIPV